MSRFALVSLISLVALAGCSSLTSIIGTEEKPSEASVARVLCTRDDQGGFVFGPIGISRKDVLTEESMQRIAAHADAWDAATKKGALCGKMGGAEFGNLKWGN